MPSNKLENIQITEPARLHIQGILGQTPEALGIRVGVKKAGCSGSKYLFEPAIQMKADDIIFEMADLKVIVDEKSLPQLKGLCIDYIQNEWGFDLDFQNPNIKSSCGCGESFNTEK